MFCCYSSAMTYTWEGFPSSHNFGKTSNSRKPRLREKRLASSNSRYRPICTVLTCKKEESAAASCSPAAPTAVILPAHPHDRQLHRIPAGWHQAAKADGALLLQGREKGPALWAMYCSLACGMPDHSGSAFGIPRAIAFFCRGSMISFISNFIFPRCTAAADAVAPAAASD